MSRPRILLLGKNGPVGGDLLPLLTEFSQSEVTERVWIALALT